MLNAYFDETGHGDDPNTKFLGIVGCGQHAEDWVEFEKERKPRWGLTQLEKLIGNSMDNKSFVFGDESSTIVLHSFDDLTRYSQQMKERGF